MIELFVGILVGFGLGLILNSEKFQDIANKLIGKLMQGNSKKAIDFDENNLEYFYKNLYKKGKMQAYALIVHLIAYSILILFIVSIVLMLFNIYMPTIKLGPFTVPGWVSLLIGNALAIIYKQIDVRFRKSIKVTFADSLK